MEVCEYECVPQHVDGGQRTQLWPSPLLGQSLLLNVLLQYVLQAGWPSGFQKVLLFLSPTSPRDCWDYTCVPLHPSFYMISGGRTHSSGVCGQYLHLLHHLTNHQIVFFLKYNSSSLSLFSFSFYFLSCVCTHVHAITLSWVLECAEVRGQCSPSTVWIPGIELRWLGLGVRSLTCWAMFPALLFLIKVGTHQLESRIYHS